MSAQWETGFTPWHHWVDDRLVGDPLARAVYSAIAYHATAHREGERVTEYRAFPGLGTIAARAGVSTSTVQRRIRRLEELGCISRKRRGKRKSNLYILPVAPPESEWSPEPIHAGVARDEWSPGTTTDQSPGTTEEEEGEREEVESARGPREAPDPEAVGGDAATDVKALGKIESIVDAGLSVGQRRRVVAALQENHGGVMRCAERARREGDVPVALFLSLIDAGEHLRERQHRTTFAETQSELAAFIGRRPSSAEAAAQLRALARELREGTTEPKPARGGGLRLLSDPPSEVQPVQPPQPAPEPEPPACPGHSTHEIEIRDGILFCNDGCGSFLLGSRGRAAG